MMKFFRKYNKQLLAVFMTLLMIVFLGGTALEGMFNPSANRVVARSRLGDITYYDQQLAAQATRPMEVMGIDWRRPLGGPGEVLQEVDWILLVREAEEFGTRAGESSARNWFRTDTQLDDVSRRMSMKPAHVLQAVADYRSILQTAFAVADADGNIVAVTQTLGTWGGNFYVSPGLGFLYNDKLGSYRTSPSAYGARLPYARHGTSIAPTLVFRGTGQAQRPFLAVGAAGNAWITSAVYQVVAATIDAGVGPQQALELPRFLVGVRRSSDEVNDVFVQIEDGYSPRVMQRLEEMGHEFQRISLRGELRMGYGAAVMIDAGMVRAGADPRRSGAAGVIP